LRFAERVDAVVDIPTFAFRHPVAVFPDARGSSSRERPLPPCFNEEAKCPRVSLACVRLAGSMMKRETRPSCRLLVGQDVAISATRGIVLQVHECGGFRARRYASMTESPRRKS